jgi:hypothetical protein
VRLHLVCEYLSSRGRELISLAELPGINLMPPSNVRFRTSLLSRIFKMLNCLPCYNKQPLVHFVIPRVCVSTREKTKCTVE